MEKFIEIFGTVMQTIIAIAGVIIAFMEVRREQKRRKTQKCVIDTVRNVKIDEKIETLKNSIDDIECKADAKEISQAIVQFENNAEMVIKEYEKFKEGIEKIYKRFLKDETFFSLSYGFERYINAFRTKLLSSDDLAGISKTINEFRELDKKFLGNVENKELRDGILKWAGWMNRKKIDHPEYSCAQVEECFIEEYTSHVPGFNRTNMGIPELAVLDYYEHYYRAYEAADKIKDSYCSLKPYVDELCIKYS